MLRSIPSLIAAATVFTSIASGQQFRRGAPDLPPDIFDNRGVDAVRLAPDKYKVEMDNHRVRVLRVKLPAESRAPIHSHRSGVMIAITAVNVRLTAPDGKVTEILLPPGDMRWIDAGIHAEENIGAAPCEYLFVESK